jgi:hypothetical protein
MILEIFAIMINKRNFFINFTICQEYKSLLFLNQILLLQIKNHSKVAFPFKNIKQLNQQLYY